MKILVSTVGLLTNFEVLDFLRNKSRDDSKHDNLEVGEANQIAEIKRHLTASEIKVYDYLIETPARNLTRECVKEFLQKSEKYNFTRTDILPILNIRPSKPSTLVELHSIVESFFERYENEADEIAQLIEEVLPPRPIIKTAGVEELVPVGTGNEVEENLSQKLNQAALTQNP
uniref:DNA-directed RNA polymerase III subunit RPC9 n=1 Tax=Kalanchoe fedtschenkoi TaxID=63787 RepID=A0A7N0T9F0_KALFE